MRNTKTIGYLLGAFSIIVWGVTFVSTKALLTDFSALEILLFRFVAAYVALWIIRPKVEKIPFKENIIFMLA
ncbi:MAG: EamA family transporter, partial [Bacteroidales bacterium]|nr:EamA family transporter [Bacteroidales bacterium]